MTLNLLVTAAYAAGFAWRYDGYHHPGAVAAGQLALSAVSLAVLAVSGYLGGKLAADSRSRAVGRDPTAPRASLPERTGRG